MPVWLPRAALIPIYWNLAGPVRLPLPITPCVNDRDHRFGGFGLKARTDKQLLQKDVAAAIEKEDGVAMSASYLNDIERDRRNPPNARIIRQLSSTLDLDEDYLWFLAGRIPPDMLELSRDQASISQAVKTLRHTLESNAGREVDDGGEQTHQGI